MSLDFKLTEIKDYETVCYDGDQMNPKTEAIIWMTMFTKVGWGLTEDNIEEFIARATMYEKMRGAVLQMPEGDRLAPMPLTREDMLAHVGLWTNVFGEPREEFLATVFRNSYPKAGEDPFAKPELDDDDEYDDWYDEDDALDTAV